MRSSDRYREHSCSCDNVLGHLPSLRIVKDRGSDDDFWGMPSSQLEKEKEPVGEMKGRRKDIFQKKQISE